MELPAQPDPIEEFAAFCGDRLATDRITRLMCGTPARMPRRDSDRVIRDWDCCDDRCSPVDAELESSVVVCSAWAEAHNPSSLWDSVRRSITLAPLAILSCDEVATPRDALDWMSQLLHAQGVAATFVGWTGSRRIGERKLVALIENEGTAAPRPASSEFRVTAIIPTFNEVDIIESTVNRLLRDQIDVIVLDNWSTDGTYELLAAQFEASRALRLERFPADGPSPSFDLGAILVRIDELAARSEADWIVRQDADEIRESPWTHLTLRDGLFSAHMRGYNCVDHTVLNFRPTDIAAVADDDPLRQLRHFEFGREPGDFDQVNAWRNQHKSVFLAGTAGHHVSFEGQRIFPYKFLLRHFPLRSQQQAERKIFRERRPRWNPGERAMGWHTHYETYEPGHAFVWDPSALVAWDDQFATDYLIERLSGVGLPREAPSVPTERRDADAREAALAERIAENERLAAWARSLESVVAERTAENERLSGLMQSLEGVVAERTAESERIASWAVGLEAVISERERERDALAREAALKDQRVRELLASTSWRLAAPARLVSAGLRATARSLSTRLRHGPDRVPTRTRRDRRRAVRTLSPGEMSPVALADPESRLVSAGEMGPASGLPQFSLPVAAGEYRPLVSILIPSYNHARFLSQRLESIFHQTYGNCEFLLLDDASTDGSQTILRDFARRFAEKTTLILNDQNSGSAFRQWARGLSLARGEVIWIAETDDVCGRSFVERLLPMMGNPAVMLAFSQTYFFEVSPENIVWTLEGYLSDVGPLRLGYPWLRSARDLVAAGFGAKNLIPNVSGAMFRHPGPMPLLRDEAWLNMRLAGDWLFYLELIRAGLVAYTPAAVNFHRSGADTLTFQTARSSRFEVEVAAVQAAARRLYPSC
jgi:glycosyltransferase involved in cell wall biosynthesis